MNFTITLEDKKLKINLKKMTKTIFNAVIKEMKNQSVKLTNYTKIHHLRGGTTDSKLRVRSGQLLRTTRAKKTEKQSGIIKGGVVFGVKYASIHVGRKGQVTTIKAKPGKALSIPLPPALTPAGVLRKPPREYNDLQMIKREGRPPLLAKIFKNKVVPYFVLKKSVKVKSRVHPEDILNANKNSIISGFRKAITEAIERKLASGQ